MNSPKKMWSSRLFWKLVVIYGGLNFVIASTFPIALSQSEEANVIGHVRSRLQGICVLARDRVQADLRNKEHGELAQMVREIAELTDVRVTLVAGDGAVIAESDTNVDTMQNHSNREELGEARQDGSGDALRRSATIGVPFLYFALPVKDKGQVVAFVRVAEEVQTIKDYTQRWVRRMWAFAFAVALLAAPITYVLAGRIVRPLSELTSGAMAIASGDYDQSITVHSRDEVGDLARAFSRMGKELATQVTQLQDQNQRMATVLGGMVEGVLAVDGDRKILVANQACDTLLDVSLESAVGRPLLEVARNADIDAAITQALSSDEQAQKEITVSTPVRRVISLFATVLPMEPKPGAVVVLHDVTELRRLESLRRDFVANVSHELKTPLASIKAYSETLKLGAIHDPENNVRFVDRISEQAEQLNQLITDLLHLARVEAGNEVFQFSEVPLGSTIREHVAEFEQLASKKNISLQLDGSDDVSGWADQSGVGTIIDNLLGNAIKYTPNDGLVTLRWFHDPQGTVLEVSDTGIGIAPENQQRIFERFFRADKARSRELGGTGLGLAIVKHLAQAFGGSVELTSELEVGSTFRVILPRDEQSRD